jgi:hypothetical protein
MYVIGEDPYTLKKQQLVGRIQRKLKEIEKMVRQNMILKVRKILRKIEDNGPLSVV